MSQTELPLEHFERIRHEHAEICKDIRRIRDALNDRDNVGAMALLLSDVRDELAEHFKNEEAGGYLDAATNYAPELTKRATELREQHTQLIAKISEIIDALTSPGLNAWDWDNVVAKTLGFLNLLLDHERAENKLVQDAYQQDIGAED